MLLTENEASVQMCPIRTRSNDFAYCDPLMCMAWRWADVPTWQRVQLAHDMHATTEPKRPAHVPQSWVFEPYNQTDSDCYARWVEPKDEANARRRGYCGLAGKPEER